MISMLNPAVSEAEIEIMALYADEEKDEPRVFAGDLIPSLLPMDEVTVNEALKKLTDEKKLYRYSDGCYSTSPKDPLFLDDFDYNPRLTYCAPTKLKLPLR